MTAKSYYTMALTAKIKQDWVKWYLKQLHFCEERQGVHALG